MTDLRRTTTAAGWYQVAFERELEGSVAAAAIGERRLLLVKEGDGWRAFDARCPHRGADLARGGQLLGGAIVCPFHGRRIGLDCAGDDGYSLRGHRTLAVGGLLFVLLGPDHENGFAELMAGLDRSHFFVPGFTIPARTASENVMENAFDRRHFRYVHGLDLTPEMALLPSRAGEMAVQGRFTTSRPNPWQVEQAGKAAPIEFGFLARVYSPALCVTELEGPGLRYIVVTAATPTAEGCVIRVSLAVPAGPDGAPPAEPRVRALLRDSRTSIEQDMAIWEHLPQTRADQRFTPDDDMIREYYRFCERFIRQPEQAS